MILLAIILTILAMLALQVGLCVGLGWLSFESIAGSVAIRVYRPGVVDRTDQYEQRRLRDLDAVATGIDRDVERAWDSFVHEAGQLIEIEEAPDA